MVNKLCPNCGKSFIVSNQNKNQECCNNKCKTELNNKRKTKQCEYCHKDFVAKSLSKNRFCSRECLSNSLRTPTLIFKCKQCGNEFEERKKGNKDSNVFCNRNCYKDYMNENRLSNILTKEEFIKRQSEKNKLKRKIKTFSVLHHLNCKECNKVFVSKAKNKKYCSHKCMSYSSKPLLNKKCTICNNDYTTKLESKNQCSDECKEEHKKHILDQQRKKNRHLRKHIDRAKKFNVEYDNKTTLFNIRKRDGKRCLLCGKKVLIINQSGYHKDNATVGHIVALSKGGNHTMQNVQLECMECNMKKGTKTLGQPRLF